MCNAYNHPANCPCGFGGCNNENINFLKNYIYHPCFINPNAKCPVCGCDVYYFQSKNGGRVFFDDLWPDWPKHPCTDNRKKVIISQQPKLHQKLNLVHQNFKPLLIHNISYEGYWNQHKLVAEIIDNDGNSTTLEQHSLYDSSQIDKYSFFFYTKTSNDSFEIKCYKLNGEETIKLGCIKLELIKGEQIDLVFNFQKEKKYYFIHLGEFAKYIFYSTDIGLNQKTLEKIARKETGIQIKGEIKFMKDEEVCVKEI